MPAKAPFCFISYSRRDTALARWLQQQLESYKYPAALVEPARRPLDASRLRPVFLDTSDLPTSSGPFWDDICAKINHARFLLVLCSRASAASEYVDKEIACFIGQDESRLDRVILAIIDPEIDLSSPTARDFPPQILQRWDRLSLRNHPIFTPREGETRSTVRQRAFMQVVSFMLGIDWTVLYNRYLVARRRVLLRAAIVGLAILTAISLSLSWALWKERELTTFERKVFPYSLVVGYVENFLSPLITSLENESDKPLIIIAMPASYKELDHNRRVAAYREYVAKSGYTATLKKVKTVLPRGAETALVVPTGRYYRDHHLAVYIDFASTVTAFRHVIDYKKKNAAYEHVSRDEMVREYSAEFENSVLALLQGNDKRQDQRNRIVFVHSPAAALEVLDRRQ